MIPILYDYSESEWTNNGIGRLSDCISCAVTEERNGIYECEFVYPVTGIHYEDIIEGRVIGVIHDDTKEIEPFDIYKRSAEINGQVTFNAHHISYRLNYTILKPFTAPTCAAAMAALVQNSINNNPFTFATDKTTTGNYRINYPRSIREILCGSEGSILDVYGTGEYEFKKYSVYLWTHRGSDSGVEIRYGKNMLDITKEVDISGSYNAVAPFWYSEDGELVTLPEEIIISPAVINTNTETWTNESLVTITNENAQDIDFDYAVINAIPMDLSGDFTDVPTVEQLREKATAKLNGSGAWLPDENIKVDFVALWQTEEYKNVAPLQRVSLCDTVSVIFPQLSVNAVKAKVVKTDYNVLLERYDSMEIGDARSSYSEVVTESIEAKMNRTMASKGFLTASLEQATKLIQGGLGGYVIMNANANGQPQEILVMDTDDINTAVNVIRINKNGIGFSRNGYDGEYKTAWTIDGHFVADFIDTGTLTADLIKAGTIRAIAGNSYWDLNTGILYTTNGRSGDDYIAISLNRGILSSRLGNKYMRIDSAQITFYQGSVYHGQIAASEATFGTGPEYKGLRITPFDSDFIALYSDSITPALIINCGTNPTGDEETVVLKESAIFYGATIKGNLLPHESWTCRLGNSDHLFDYVYTNRLYFSNGVNMYYSATNDYIYASKTIHQASDENLKNIEPYDNKYDDLIDVLEPITYTWKDSPNKNKFIGLGARKTAALLDKCGIKNSGFVGIDKDEDGKDVYSVDYNELSVMLLHKVQTQQEEIKNLKTQLEDVLKRLERLEAR